MIAYLLLLLGISGTEAAHFIERHRAELAAVLAAVAAWVIHRARRQVTHTGTRVTGMPRLEAVSVRRPELVAKRREATAA